MNNYTQKIPCELADKLKKVGMPMETISEEEACFNRHITEIVKEIRCGYFVDKNVYYQLPTYAEVFDWIIGQGIFVSVAHAKVEGGDVCWYPIVNRKTPQAIDGRDWEHSAILAIEKALELKEHRKPYKGAKAVAMGCRNHGGGHHNECPWCAGNRQHNNKKQLQKAKEYEKEE